MITQVPLSTKLEGPIQHKSRTEPFYAKHITADLKPLQMYITNYIHSKLSLPRFKDLHDHDLHDLRDHVTVDSFSSGALIGEDSSKGTIF
jgi:hypothetical protein